MIRLRVYPIHHVVFETLPETRRVVTNSFVISSMTKLNMHPEGEQCVETDHFPNATRILYAWEIIRSVPCSPSFKMIVKMIRQIMRCMVGGAVWTHVRNNSILPNSESILSKVDAIKFKQIFLKEFNNSLL